MGFKRWTDSGLPEEFPKEIKFLSDLTLPIRMVLAKYPSFKGDYANISMCLWSSYELIVTEEMVRHWYEYNYGDDEDLEKENRKIFYYGTRGQLDSSDFSEIYFQSIDSYDMETDVQL